MAETPHWAWNNLGNGLSGSEVAEVQILFFEGRAPIDIYRAIYYGAAGIILLFVVLALLCKRFDIGRYRGLPDASRLVFVCHNAFFLIFLTTAVPYSIALVKVLFAPTAPLPLLQSSMYRCMSFPLALQVGMYVLEGGCRAVMRINTFLVVHHVVFCTFSVLAFQAESLFLLKVNIVVSCFATYEFLLYAALIARKMPTMVRSETVSSELPDALRPEISLARSTMATAGSTDMFSSQTLLLDDILEGVPYRHSTHDIV
ncbi:MAG: hypothetical protein FRX49_01461 [Trebouxia sp. A1-2]|nr:MAG: hypothetical protein FRX49_01461 [Trebouxia sp. A1-2]